LNQNKANVQHHTIEVFSANCQLCKEVTDVIEIGRCQGWRQIVYDTNNMTDEIKMKMENYNVRAVPTTIIDGEIKVVGVPDFPWICGEDFYKMLKIKYPLKIRRVVMNEIPYTNWNLMLPLSS